MKARAIVKNVNVSSRKAGLVCDLIRGKKVKDALVILDHTSKKTAKILKKLLNSAVANATNNHAMIGDKLYIYEIFANQGTTMKRTLPRAKGSADMIRKRHSHLEIVLSDDPKERQTDLNAIKIRLAKRTKGSKKVKLSTNQEAIENQKEVKQSTTKKAIPLTKGDK